MYFIKRESEKESDRNFVLLFITIPFIIKRYEIKEKENYGTEIIAVVAGREIKESDFEKFLQNVPREQQAYLSNPQFRQQCLDQFVALHMFAELGGEMKLEETEEYQEMVENAKRDILAQMTMREVMKDAVVTEEDVKNYYEEHKQQFTKGETVRAKHILTDSKEKCDAILAAIQSGETSFEDAAKEKSTCPSGAKGGDLGEFGKGQMVKEFEDAAFTAEIGAIVGPVQTQFGYHLIKVEEKKDAAVADFEEVKNSIRNQLLQQRQNKVYSDKVKELREKYVQE